MKKFEFKLTVVLAQRKKKEEDCLLVLAKAQKIHQEELHRKNSFILDLEAALIRREKLGTQPITVDVFYLEQSFITGVKQRILQSEHAIVRAYRGVEKAMRTYLHTRRQTRKIEILKEKAFQEFCKNRLRREEKVLDDLIIMRTRLNQEAS